MPSYCGTNCTYKVDDSVAYKLTGFSQTSTGLSLQLTAPLGANNVA